MRKRLLSIVLILCLVAPMLPTIALPNLTAQAETTTDAFGINVDETMTEEEMAETIANNPYGTEEWFTLFSVSELALTMGTSDTRSWYTYNYNEDGDVGAITTAQSGTRTGYSEGNESNNGYSIVDTAACDAANEGQDRYTAVLAYDRGESTISLFLKDKSGNTVSNVISLGSSSTLGYLKDSEAYYNSSLLSIAAGDFDNDGVESLIVYIPYMVKGTPAIYEYTISGSADSFKLTQKSTVIGNVYSLLGVTDLSSKESGDGKARRNTPVVQLVAEDTDNDNVDELIITAGLSNVATKNISERQSKMFIYDYIQDGSETVSKGWYQSFELDTGGSDASQRLRYASSAVGNAIVDNNANTDYPEVITVGWVDSSLGASDSISHDIGTYITQCTKASKIDGTTSVGSYTATSAGNLTRDDETVSEFTEGGHYKNDDIQSLVQVSVALLDGLNSQAYVLVADTVLQYGETGWEYIYRYEYFNDDDDGIGSSIISNGAVIDVVSGNFDANIEGREQFIIATCQKRSGRNDYFYRLYTYQTPSGNSGADNSKGYQSSDYSIYKIGYTYLSLCTPDIDNDSTLAKVAETKLTYTEPEILTILEAPPYYAELDGGDIGNSTTSYSSATGSESSETTTSEVSAGFITGFEYSQDACTGLSSGGGYEASVEVGLTWEATESTSFEYEMSFDNDTGENAVVVYRRPVTTWKYELKNDESSFLTISQEGDLMTSMMTVDEYNEAAASFDNLEQITDDMLATPGDPFSYRSSALGLDNVAVYGQYATYTSGGTTAQSMTVGTGSESSFTYGLSTSFSVYGIYFGFKAGVTAGYSHSTTTSTVTTSSVTKTGAVTGNSRDGYDFNWMFGHWTMEINGQEVPVLGYFLKNVVGPPSPPVNLHAEDITSSSAKLVWDESNRSADAYRIYQVYTDGTTVQIGEVDGEETSYQLTGLSANTSYTYAVSAWSSDDKVYSGESVLSDEVIVTTLPENEAAVTIVSPEDISVQVGGSATFKASITVVADTYTATNYQWQSRTSGGSWEDVSKATGSKLTLTDVAKEDDGTEYRCVFLISYTNLNAAIRYYSDAATLSVGAIGVNVDLTVSGHDGTGAGTLDDPYVGTATTNAQTGTTETTVSSTVPVTIAADSEADTPELTVYSLTTESGEGESKTETTSYYGVGTDADGETVYYAVTKSTDEEGNDSYTAGSPIEVTETVTYYDENGAKAELSFTLNQITYIATNADESTTTYYLMADVNGTTKTAIATDEEETRLASISGITYYWVSGGKCYAYAGAEEVGAAVSGVDADDLYDVLYQDDGNLVLGRTEKWGVQIEVTDDEGNTTIAYDTETGYVYTQVSTSGSGDNTTYTVNSVLTAEVAVSYSDTTFDPGSLEAVTQTIKETVETAVYEAQDGTALTLTADVAAQGDGTAAKNATVDFQIVNIDTGSTETVTAVTESDGTATATWTASASGLYSIQAVVRADATYAKATSEKEYYQADAIYAMETETTEYRLVLQSGSTTLDGTATYGDTVSLVLQSRTVTVETGADGKLTTTRGSWENVSGSVTYEASLSGSEDNTAIAGSSYTPNTVGSYTMYAYLTVTEGETTTKTQVAAASLTVKQRSVTIMPTWDEGTVPSGTNDVTVTADSLASQDSDLELKTIFGISCSYFDLEDKTAASGSYIVSLYYMTYGDTTDAADVETTEETEEEEESGLTPEEEELAAAVKAFKKNYQVTMESDSFYIQKGSARVNFSADENGTLTGQYSDMKFKMATGSRQTTGTALYFTAAPDTGYAVSTWTINGTSYATSDELPAGFEFALDGKQLVVESFDAVEHVGEDGTLTVSVQFASVSNTITYSVDQNGGGSLAAVNGSGQSLSTGASVTNGASVTFTATPDEGYIVDSWSVNGEKWLWDGTEETYAGTTLTLKEIEEDQTVIVSFRESEDTYEVSTKVVDEDEKTDASLATVSAVDAETGETVELSEEVTEGTSLTFTAALTEENNHTVKCWQVSTDGGKSYTTITGSGGQTSVTVYNIAADTQVRVVVTVAQTYVLKYSVVYDDETVDNEELASLTAASNGQKLESGSAVSAYIPVDFTLDLDEDYYVIEWQSKGVSITEDSEDPLKASLESLTEATTVTVVIGKKPVITIEMSEYGSVSVKNGDAAIENGDSVEPGTDLTVTLTPATGYVVDTESLPEGWTYTDTDGTTTDEVTYTIEDVTKDQTVKAAFKELETVQVTYSIVVTTGGQDNGSVTASAARKGLDDYEVDPLESGKTVYAGSTVTFTAAPDEGYRVQEWKVNGEVYKTDAGITYIGETLTLSDLAQATTVTVQFVQKGDEVTVAAGDNGSITSAMVGSNDVTGNIDTGFTLSTDASVTVTAAGDPGYEPDTWLVDGAVVQNGGTTYTYTATGTTAGAAIQVTFRQQEYPVSWTATGGSVTAVDEEEAEYTGSSASIRGGIVVTFTATADDGSVLDYWTVNGEKTEAAEDGSLQWTVPNGAAATPAVTAYEIEAVFKNAPYEILFAQPENGTLSAVDAAGEELLSGGEAENNTDVTFTVTPKDGFLVESWTVNGTPVESQEPTLKMTVTGKTEVSVTLVPDSYTVSYAAEGKGTVAAGEGASVSSGEVSVAYDGSVTFTATPKNSYYMVKGWKIDGEEVTEGVSADKTTLTLSHVKAKATVTAVFTSALGFTVAYSVVGNTGGSLSALVDDEIILTLDEGQSTTVAADSKLEFTAAPEEGMMVSAWTLNGAPVEGNLSTSLVIDKLLEKVTVTVAYEELMTYQVPSTNTGYTVTVTKKVPSDTPGEGDQEIRKNGTVTFIVALADGYNLLTALTVNDTYIWDCLKDEALETEESGETEDPEAAAENVITVQPNEDGSYTITVSNVTQDITLGVTAHKLTHVEAKAATCEENGNIEYWYCSDCEKYFTDAQAQNEITEEETILPKEKVEHSYTAKFTWEGTGSATVSATCDVCGDEVKDLAADITSETSGSSITFTATATYTDEETGLKYTFTDTRTLTEVARKEATCAAAGNIAYWVEETTKTYYSDSTATEELKEVVIAKLTADTDHSWGSPVFTWTGVTTAKVTLTCSVCGKTKTLDATVTRTLSSDGSTATFKAQVTSNEKTYTDSRTLTKVAAKAATCAAAGNIEYWKDTASGTCYSDSTGAKAVSASSVTLAKKTADTDHSWGNPTWSWSGTKSATLTLTCSVCGATKSVKGTVTCTEGTDYNTYKAVAEYNGKNYTDKKKVEVDKVWEDVVFILKGTATKTKNTLKWNKIPGADGYVIYGAKCGSDTYKKLKTITSSKTTSWTRKSLKANSAYKYYVKAYRLVNGKKKFIKKSNLIHLSTKGGKYTNVSKVKITNVTDSKLTLKVGKTKTLKVKTTLAETKKVLRKHMDVLTYSTTDKTIATVSSKGKIKAKKKGTCYIYVQAASGYYAKVKVTVK